MNLDQTTGTPSRRSGRIGPKAPVSILRGRVPRSRIAVRRSRGGALTADIGMRTMLVLGLLAGCATVTEFKGVVRYPDGTPATGLRVTVLDEISAFNTPPWQWGPGYKVRGRGATDAAGRFVVPSTAAHPLSLWVEGAGIWEGVASPRPEVYHRITVGQTKIGVRAGRDGMGTNAVQTLSARLKP